MKEEELREKCEVLYDVWQGCIEREGYNECIHPHRRRYYQCIDYLLYAPTDSPLSRLYKFLYLGSSDLDTSHNCDKKP